jgi:AcrR family transcriptional regulator
LRPPISRVSSIIQAMTSRQDAAAQDRQSRNERRRATTRARLLGAARRLFASQGFEATTMRDIANEADMALGSFYNYFRTKDEVLEALLEEALREQLRLLILRQEQVEDAAERISIAHRHLLAAVREDPDWGWLLLRLQVDHRALDAALSQRAASDLRAGVEAGRFEVANPLLALRASGGALLGVVQGVLRGEFGAQDDCAHAEGVLRGLGVPAREAAEIARRPLPALPASTG